MKHSKEQVDQAVDLYLQGVKAPVIQERTGVPRAALYWHLGQRGHAPSRQASAKMGGRVKPSDGATFGWAMQRIEEQAVRIAALEAALTEAGIDPSTIGAGTPEE